MKSFVVIALILLIYMPTFAQDCEEGDVQLPREGDIVSLKECRSGVLNHPFIEDFQDFLDANQNDSMLISALAALDIHVHGFVNRLFGATRPPTLVLSTDFGNKKDIEYIANKYRQWITEDNERTDFL